MTMHITRLIVVLGILIATTAPARAQAPTEEVEYYGRDAIGSIRVVFDANGAITGRMDYAPFGQELRAAAGLPPRRFARLVRDGEVGLDYAQARSYQVRTGRFNAPDPIFTSRENPQTWNRYSYAFLNPVSFTDPSGLCVACLCPSGECSPSHERLIGWMFGSPQLPPIYGEEPDLVAQRKKGAPSRAKKDPDDPKKPDGPKPPEPCVGKDCSKPRNDPKDPPEPDCGGSSAEHRVWVVQSGGVFAPIMGVDLGGGAYWVPKTGEWGFFGSRGLAIGISAGLGVEVGTVDKMSNFKGRATTLNGGVFGGTATVTEAAGHPDVTGFLIGPSPFGQIWGFHNCWNEHNRPENGNGRLQTMSLRVDSSEPEIAAQGKGRPRGFPSLGKYGLIQALGFLSAIVFMILVPKYQGLAVFAGCASVLAAAVAGALIRCKRCGWPIWRPGPNVRFPFAAGPRKHCGKCGANLWHF